VLGFVSVGVPRIGFITANGPEPGSAPCVSLSETWNTCPSVNRELFTEMVNCVVLTNVGVPTETPSNRTSVFVLKFPPVTVTAVVGSPTWAAAGVSEVKNATALGFTSVSWIFHMLRPCVAARRMRLGRLIAKPRTGEFGKPSPITVHSEHKVNAGAAQVNTPTSVPIYTASNRGVVL
jgi:hypothetical protein